MLSTSCSTYGTVVSFFPPRHDNKQEGNLFSFIAALHERVDCKQLAKGLATEFEGPVDIPVFGLHQLQNLLAGANTDVSFQEIGRNVFFRDIKR